MLLEVGAAMLEAEMPDQFAAHLAELGSSDEQAAIVGGLWRSGHPRAVEVLESLGRAHPDKKVAKVARKAAFQARSRRSER